MVWHFVDDSTDKNIAGIGLIKRNTPVSFGYKTIENITSLKASCLRIGFSGDRVDPEGGHPRKARPKRRHPH